MYASINSYGADAATHEDFVAIVALIKCNKLYGIDFSLNNNDDSQESR